MLNPMARLATAEKLTQGRSAKKAIEQSPNRNSTNTNIPLND
jgi:hypothetical protein